MVRKNCLEEKKIGEFVGQVGSVKCKYSPQANWMCMLKMESILFI